MIFMATATASAIKRVKAMRTRPTRTPSARASSSCTVTASSGRQINTVAASTAPPPP